MKTFKRFEYIVDGQLVISNYDKTMEYDIQDDGQTIKVFIKTTGYKDAMFL